MDFHNWSQQYQEEAERIQQHIQTLKQEADGQPGNTLSQEQNGRIYTLYGMYLECKHTAALLEEYARRQENGSV